jgi:hypothetical protein
MRIPPPAEVRQHLREFGSYFWAVVCHYYLLLGGVVVGATVTLFPESYQGVRVSGWLISACLIFIATFLAWMSERQRANEQHQKVLEFEAKMKSRIQVSCGKSADKSVVPVEGEMWFRARLDLEGCTPIPDIEAAVKNYGKMGKRFACMKI